MASMTRPSQSPRPLFRALRMAFNHFQSRQALSGQQAQLAHFNARLLDDVGLTDDQDWSSARRPPWETASRHAD